MNKTSKSVLTVLFAAVFALLIFCIVQINETQQGIMLLTEKLAVEVAGTDNAPQVQVTPGIVPKETATPQATPTSAPMPSPAEQQETTAVPQTETVYWVPNGKVWHTTPNCSTLSRSNNILSGTIEESGKARACKKCG